MNYLSHYVCNHEVAGLPVEPWFVAGVALPDLWPRFSRRQRLHWPSVRSHVPRSAADAALRAGLLNHVEMDQKFHLCPPFLGWLREVKAALPVDSHSAVREFVAHVAIELALDHHLVVRDPGLPERFYADLTARSSEEIARRAGCVGRVATQGLARVIERFVARGFLYVYRTRAGLVDVLERVIGLTNIRQRPAIGVLRTAVDQAVTLARPDVVWAHLAPDGEVRRATA